MKKMFSAIAAVVLSVSLSAGSVMAAPSKTSNVTASNGYIIRNDIDSAPSFQQLKQTAPGIANGIDKVNSMLSGDSTMPGTAVTDTLKAELKDMANDPSLPASARESAGQVEKEISDKNLQAATGFFDLDADSANATKTKDGRYDVILNFPMLTRMMLNVTILHFSITRTTWEMIQPYNVDYNRKNIGSYFQDFSPVMILCNVSTSGSSSQNGSTGTANTSGSSSAIRSPKTEDTTGSWLGYAVAAIALAGAGVLVIRRKRA